MGSTAGLVVYVFGQSYMGLGDIYLIFVLGFYLSLDMMLQVLLSSLIFALVTGIMFRIFTDKRSFPLAPAFLIGTIYVLW